jgi:hypothetical protein
MKIREVTSVLVTLVMASSACSRTVDRRDGRLPDLQVPEVAPSTIRMDGRLDEGAWQEAPSTGPFVHPRTGRPVPESPVNATARLLWDEMYLYVGCVVQDADPVSPFRTDEVDPHVWKHSSAVEVMLQPGDPGDNTDYYEVQVDVAGATWDTKFDDYNTPVTRGPDGQERYGHQEWTSRVRKGISVERAASRYVIELALPWEAFDRGRSAAPPRNGERWRINLYSFRSAQRQAMAWSPLMGQGNFHRASRFARVTFLTDTRR